MMSEPTSLKKYSKLPIVFFGSGPVAAESLRLLSEDFIIEAVVTKPTTKSEMLMVVSEDLVFSVSTKTELNDLIATKKFSSKVGVLIDFGIIVSQKTIDYFPKGIVNSHFSLLPELRGADPISFAILEGKTETGVSLMLLVEAMDEGPILSIGTFPLNQTETGPELTQSLIKLSHELMRNTLPAYVYEVKNSVSNSVPVPRSQEEACQTLGRDYKPTYTRKLTKADGVIDWMKGSVQIDREIRAFLEWPKSRAAFGGIDCVVTSAEILGGQSGQHGSMFTHEKKLAVYCGKDALLIHKIKPAGKKEMDTTSFLAGYSTKLDL